jgi:uncharacterized protein (TIRG00374 family)
MNSKRLHTILILAKITLAAGLLAWVLSQVHFSDYTDPASGEARAGVLSAFESLHWGLATLGLMGFGISLLLTGVRFWLLLRVQEIRISLGQSIRLTFLGQFYNMIVPGTIGGDVIKAWHISRHCGRVAPVLVTIVTDRLIGLGEFVVLSLISVTACLSLNLASWEEIHVGAIATFVAAGLCGGVLCVMVSPRLRKLLHLEMVYRRTSLAHHFDAAGDCVTMLSKHSGILLAAWAISAIGHVCFLGGIAIIGMGLGLDVPWWSYFIYLPLIQVLAAVPLTPGSVGVTEELYIRSFATAGAAASMVLPMALLARIIPMLWALPGLWVVLTGTKLPKAADIAAELAEQEEQEYHAHHDAK